MRSRFLKKVLSAAFFLLGSWAWGADVHLPTLDGGPGLDTVVPIVVGDAGGAYGMDLHFTYDPAVAIPLAVYRTAFTQSFSLAANLSQSGKVKIALYGTSPLTGTGEVAWVYFRGVAAPPASTALHWTYIGLNEGTIPATSYDGNLTMVGALPLVHLTSEVCAAAGADVWVAVLGEPADGFQDITLGVHYNPNQVQVVSVSLTSFTAGFGLVYDIATPGLITATLTGTNPLSGSGELIQILFHGLVPAGERAPLDLASVTVNAGGITVVSGDTRIEFSPDADGDGALACLDCDDSNNAVYPGATETCNGIDDDCDNSVDEGFDADEDGVASCFDNCPDLANPLQEDTEEDGSGDPCDCAPLDPLNGSGLEVGDSLMVQGAAPTLLSWNTEGNPGPYRWYRGSIRPGDPWSYNQSCAGFPVQGSSVPDSLTPLSGTSFFYLISRQGCPESVLGRDSAGNSIPNNHPCPLPGYDPDADGVEEAIDNCPGLYNPLQDDVDADSRGGLCDNCPAMSNPSQENLDGDSLGDACDDDMDGDGVLNTGDNCPRRFNPLQEDTDQDGTGDACE